jgi:glycosyltransferase involved in cell wall biosynthesis
VDFVLHGDAGIIPYRYDGFAELVLPTKAYEQAWMQRPIIASDTDAIRSMFRSGSILLCDPNSPQSFADALVELYHHPELRQTLAERAAEDYTPYRWEQVRSEYQELLASFRRRTVRQVPATNPR